MGAIVKVDKRHHRKIAQENWGLTKQQMKGMHVHHRIPVSEGGTNDPSNLYVCSPSCHSIWHGGDNFTAVAISGGRKGGSANTPKQQEVRKRSQPNQVEAVRKTGLANRGKKYKTTHNNQAKVTNSQKWECLVTGKVLPPGPLSHWQKNRGIDTSLRRKVS